jgi:hypothetical protein
MSAKHTPGPWIWGDDFMGLYGAGPDNEVLSHASYEGMWVSYGPCREANARLIAAAPELLEALIRMCQVFPTDIDMAEAGWNAREIDDACTAHEVARAAIQKATAGETE